jgi:hypothetical protein
MAFRHFLCGEKRIFAQCRQTHHEWWATPPQVGFWKVPKAGTQYHTAPYNGPLPSPERHAFVASPKQAFWDNLWTSAAQKPAQMASVFGDTPAEPDS